MNLLLIYIFVDIIKILPIICTYIEENIYSIIRLMFIAFCRRFTFIVSRCKIMKDRRKRIANRKTHTRWILMQQWWSQMENAIYTTGLNWYILINNSMKTIFLFKLNTIILLFTMSIKKPYQCHFKCVFK